MKQKYSEKLRLNLSPPKIDSLDTYRDLILEKNKAVNLVSRKLSKTDIENHLLHSLSITKFCSIKDGQKVLDVGTGGGLPGVPLAIYFPKTQFVLVDSVKKKITACESMIQKLGLKNVTLKHTRIEKMVNASFDFIVSRQVASLKTLCSWVSSTININGQLIVLKGYTQAIQEASKLMLSKKTNGAFPKSYKLYKLDFLGEAFKGKAIVCLF